MDDPQKKIFKIEIGGKDDALFAKLRHKLINAVDRILDSAIDYQTGTTVREEAKKLTSLTLNFAEESLKKPGIENQLKLAEIEGKYAAAQRDKSETQRIDIETRKLQFEQSLREMSFTIKLTKALLIGKEGEETVVLVKQLNAFLDAMEEVRYIQGENDGLIA